MRDLSHLATAFLLHENVKLEIFSKVRVNLVRVYSDVVVAISGIYQNKEQSL